MSVVMKFANTCTRMVQKRTRQYSSHTKAVKKPQPTESEKNEIFPPKHMKNNWVGPPHPVSNLRLVKFHKPSKESETEKYLREKQEEVQQWNQEFWEQHNSKFYQMREEFIITKKKELFGDAALNKNAPLPPDEMSKFYKKFLDDNYAVHMKYNREWYKKNVGLLMPAILTFLYRIRKRLKFMKC